MTKIFFERTGGFMGRKVTATIDLGDVSNELAESAGPFVGRSGFLRTAIRLDQAGYARCFHLQHYRQQREKTT